MVRYPKSIVKTQKKMGKKEDRQEIKTQHNEDASQQKQEVRPEEKKEKKEKKQKCKEMNELQHLKGKIQAKFNAFKDLATQIYKLKGEKSQKEIEEEVQKKITSANAKLELISQIYIKEQMKSVENLITAQKQKISQDIIKIRKAHDESKASLQAANAFSQQEITSQLASIQKKITMKQQAISKFDQFHSKIKAF